MSNNLDAIVEALNGGMGSAISKTVTFPLDLIKTRMASAATRTSAAKMASDIVKREGVPGLYKGLRPKLIKSVTGKVLYFYLYKLLGSLFVTSRNEAMSAAANLVVGFCSELFELPVIMPLEAIATRTQTSKMSFWEAYSSLYAEGKLYVALDAYVLGAFQPAIQNTLFDQMRMRVQRPLSTLESFALGVIASSLAITLTYPLDFARTKAQTTPTTSPLELEKGALLVVPPRPPLDLSMMAIWRRTIAEDGLLGVFAGLKPHLTAGVVSAALMLTIRDQINSFNRKMVYRFFATRSPPRRRVPRG